MNDVPYFSYRLFQNFLLDFAGHLATRRGADLARVPDEVCAPLLYTTNMCHVFSLQGGVRKRTRFDKQAYTMVVLRLYATGSLTSRGMPLMPGLQHLGESKHALRPSGPARV